MSPDEFYGAQKAERSAFPPETPVGMCYVPVQKITTVYEPANAYQQGTLFPDLDKPWLAGRSTVK